MEKYSVPKGTRDFLPIEMVRRNYIFDVIREVFQRFGYLPIETPAMENLTTLLGKCGEEGDKLLFRILDSGDFLKDSYEKLLKAGSSGSESDSKSLSKEISSAIAAKGLRFDLTVPFARFVVQHRDDITFPFKRYQIQPVWRADRPQKGRYREFYQCDVDVIGSYSLLNEVELIQISNEIFNKLGINVVIKINNRKILYGITESLGEAENFNILTTIIDKLGKIGAKGVIEEMRKLKISENAVNFFEKSLTSENGGFEIKNLEKRFSNEKTNSQTGLEGIQEIRGIFNYLENLTINTDVELDMTLARGLDYYTGTIIEVLSKDIDIGSIAGGGRYDDLTGIFGLKNVPGVGISFGADRIYDVLDQTKAFPEKVASTTILLFINFGPAEEKYCMKLLEKVRKSGISAEIYPDYVKVKKQMNYANNINIPYVALVGEDEMRDNVITLRNMKTGLQVKVSVEELIKKLT
jgi:histidyl-tRNA synthetase